MIFDKDTPEASNIELLPVHNRKSHASASRANIISDILDILPDNLDSSSTKDTSTSNNTLPPQDKPQFYLLIMLYLLQGIPIGLAFGSIPFLLKSKLSYTQVGIFSLASYPYSLKLLWSPIVDAIFSKKLGRRKSWIIPIQLISGCTLIYLGSSMNTLLSDPVNNLNRITFTFFILIFLCATQDIAVDGWALTILSSKSLSYASTAQTIGLNTGYFLSFTIFLSLNSPDFANAYLRRVPSDEGVISIDGYLKFWGVVYLTITALLYFFVDEVPLHLAKNSHSGVINNNNHSIGNDMVETTNKQNNWQSLKTVYDSMFKVLKLSNIQVFILIHLVSKIGFQANEAATNLKLLEKGFPKEDLAITVLIDFPFEIIFGYYIAKWSNGKDSLNPWLFGFIGRLVAALLAQLVVYCFPSKGKINTTYFLFVILQHLLGSFMSTIQFVSVNAFHTQISDPLIGGTYMTTLNTVSNLGGQWPRIIVLNLIDYFTISRCVVDDANLFQPQVEFCSSEVLKEQCLKNGGACNIEKDGFYTTNLICISISLALFFLFIKPKVLYLQKLPTSQWRVKP